MPRRRKIPNFTDDTLNEIMVGHGIDAVDELIKSVKRVKIDGKLLPSIVHEVILATANDPRAVSKAFTDYCKNLHELAQYQHPKHRPVETNTKIDATINITIKQFGEKPKDEVIDVTPEPQALPAPDEPDTPSQLEAEEALPTASLDPLPG